MSLGASNTHIRTAADEVADENEILQNYVDQKYHDWPNEAGVSGVVMYSR